MISAKEAAERTGMSKAGIMKAIKTGKLSATKNLNGEWEIDPAELFRVYDPLPTSAHSTPPVSSELVVTKEEHLETQLALQREIIEKQEETIRLLNERLQAQDRAMLMLEDKGQPAHTSPEKVRANWWQRLLQRVQT